MKQLGEKPAVAWQRQAVALFVLCVLCGLFGGLSPALAQHIADSYDDWSTAAEDGRPGLNGDLLIWNPVLKTAFEISSMGIRVDRAALLRQLGIRGCPERRRLFFHRRLLAGALPLSIGGGLGQSRLCMYYLRKAHIGEIQSSLWPDAMIRTCRQHHIQLL